MRTINADIDTLGRCLGAVILEQEGEAFFWLEEQVRAATKRHSEAPEIGAEVQALLAAQPVEVAEKLIHAFSIYFLLVNIAEEHARVRRVQAAPKPRQEGLEQALMQLREMGYAASAARELIGSVDLGLTFTAHPTEMRRRTVRAHLEQISALVDVIDAPDAVEQITAHVEALWNTPRLRARQPTVRDEVNAGLSYLEVIGSVVPQLEQELAASFERVFGEPAVLRLPLSLHSWMGGDRDGNPEVTPNVTQETFALHTQRARNSLLGDLDRAYIYVSQTTPEQMEDGAEPYRHLLLTARRALTQGAAATDIPKELANMGTALTNAMLQNNQARSYAAFAQPLIVRSRVFGVHLLSLDLREHSAQVGNAVDIVIKTTRGANYAPLDENGKTRLLRELLARDVKLGAESIGDPALRRVLDPMRVAANAMQRAGKKAFGHYVVSMSEAPSDLLEVLLLAREVGLDTVPVPLFETLDDLQRAPVVMQALLAMPEYRAVLGEGASARVQEVMIGYSDSNKDAGFTAANWALHQAQRELADVFGSLGVRYRFFHGRGTSVGRGGGPMVRGILAQPAGTIGAGLRITEQGEALSAKYNTPALAHRNLEQGLHGLLVAAGRKAGSLDPAWTNAMDLAADAGVKAYRGLVQDPGFLPFFEAITPIGEIAKLRIASRPVRRPGTASLANLRAIPWVMAWTQCRAIVPGWYGVGDALATIELPLAQRMYQEWPFFRAMIDNAQMALAKSEMQIFALYQTLADDRRLGATIETAFATTKTAVQSVIRSTILDSEPTLQRSIWLRNPYIEPIHRLQVELLRKARALDDGAPLPPDLERTLVLSLHGIAAGMQNTG